MGFAFPPRLLGLLQTCEISGAASGGREYHLDLIVRATRDLPGDL